MSIQWNKPVGDEWGEGLVRTSKCGRYRIIKRQVCAYFNGCYRPSYELEVTRNGETEKHDELDTLRDAKEWAKQDAEDNG